MILQRATRKILEHEVIYRIPVAFLYPEQYEKIRTRIRNKETELDLDKFLLTFLSTSISPQWSGLRLDLVCTENSLDLSPNVNSMHGNDQFLEDTVDNSCARQSVPRAYRQNQ